MPSQPAYLLTNWRYIQVLLIYDHVITFDQEVSRIWRPKWTGATVLFVLNRYLGLSLALMNLVLVPNKVSVCE